jgi:hypothetical protein
MTIPLTSQPGYCAGNHVDDPSLANNAVIAKTRAWLEQAVIGLNLCPFAKAVYNKRQIRYCVTGASDTDTLFNTFCDELQWLSAADPAETDTTLIIHPEVLKNFDDYNDFLALTDATMRNFGLEGVIQVASFHPEYQFDNTNAADIENYTNRSPYPMLHLLREESISKAVDSMADTDEIVERNIKTLRLLGTDGWQALPIIAQNK